MISFKYGNEYNIPLNVTQARQLENNSGEFFEYLQYNS